MDGAMINVLMMFGGIMLFMVVITFLDWLGRRRERGHQQKS